ncbi:hypothetical protein AHF37_04441, partial [Paragonimus kellicotti]
RDPQILVQRKATLDRQQAAERFASASHAQKQEQLTQKLRDSEPRMRLSNVRAAERERAKLIATLPKPAPSPCELEPDLLEVQPSVILFDAAANIPVRSHTIPSTVTVTGSGHPDHSVEAGDENAGVACATLAAELENEKLDASRHVYCLQTQENRIKADLRGQQAIKRERVRRHYQALISRLNELDRCDTLRRRHKLEVGDNMQFGILPGGPEDKRVIDRRLEQTFETELLRQIALSQPQSDEGVALNSIEQASQASRFLIPAVSGEDSEEDALGSVADSCVSVHLRGRKRAVFSSRENQMDVCPVAMNIDPETKTNAVDLENHVVSVPSELNVNDNMVTVDRLDKLVQFDHSTHVNQPLPSQDTLGHSDESSSQVIVDTPASLSVAKLGPGERPELPSLRRTRIVSRAQSITSGSDVWAYTSTLLHPKQTDQEDQSTTSGPSSTVISETSLSDPSSSRSTQMSTVQSDLMKRQLELDEELIAIEKRLARVRMAAATDMSVTVPCARDTPVSPHPESSDKSKQLRKLTPRETYLVEGFSAGDKSTQSPHPEPEVEKNTAANLSNVEKFELSKVISADQPLSDSAVVPPSPLLNGLPKICVEKLASLIRAQMSAVCVSSESEVAADICRLPSPTQLSCHESDFSVSDAGEVSVTHSPRPQSPPLKPPTSTDPLANKNRVCMKQFNQSATTVPLSSNSRLISHRLLNNTLHQVETPDSTLLNSESSEECKDHVPCSLEVPASSGLSHSAVSTNEQIILRSISKLASRLTRTAIYEASAELTCVDSSLITTSKFEPHNNVDFPAVSTEPPASQPSSPSSIEPAVDIQSSSTRSTTLSSADSLKAELRSLLTSSLLNSLINTNRDSTALAGGSSTSQLLRRLLNSGSLSQLGTSLGLSNDELQRGQTKSRPPSDKSQTGQPVLSVTSPSSTSNEQTIQSSVTANGPKENSLSDSPTSCHTTSNGDVDRPICSAKQPSMKDLKQRILSDYVKVNKGWLLSLAGEKKPLKLESLSSSASPSHSGSSPSLSFRHLSPADPESDSISGSTKGLHSSTVNIENDLHNSSSGFDVCLSSVSRSPIVNTTRNSHTASFKPLPRLEEATSEESVGDSSPPTLIKTICDEVPDQVDSMQTQSTSWSDSRRSSDFVALSRCSLSTSSTQHEPQLPNQPDSSGTDLLTLPSETETTIQQLRTNLPPTPIEPLETEVVDFIGSNMSSASSYRHPDSLVRELLETSDGNFWMHNLPPMVRAGPQNEQPPALAVVHSRTTTTIDSSIVWDEAEGQASRQQATTPTASLAFSTSHPSPGNVVVVPCDADPITRSASPGVLLDHHKLRCTEARPTSPAEGSPRHRSLDQYPGKISSRPTFKSMPTILVDCESEASADISRARRKSPVDACKDRLSASWGNFGRKSPCHGSQPSVSDSLLSFQRHEASLSVVDPPLETNTFDVKGSAHPLDQTGFRPLLEAKPDRVDANMVQKNAHTIRSAVVDQLMLRKAPSNNPTVAQRSWKLVGSVRPLVSRPVSHSRDPPHTEPLVVATENVSKVKQLQRASIPVCYTRKSQNHHPVAPRDRKPRHPAGLISGKESTRSNGYSNENTRQRRLKKTSTAASSSNISAKRTSLSKTPLISSQSSTNRSTAAYVSVSHSLVHITPATLEQSLREKLSQWRSSRLGLRDPSYRSPPSERPSLQPTVVLEVTSSAGSNHGYNSAVQSSVDRVDFASVHPGPPPAVVERTFEDDTSSTTVWLTDMSHTPSLEPRPSSPTPRETGLMITESEELSAPTNPRFVSTAARAPGSALPTAGFVTDLDGLELPSTACAGDEVPSGRRHATNEVRFADCARVLNPISEFVPVQEPNTDPVLPSTSNSRLKDTRGTNRDPSHMRLSDEINKKPGLHADCSHLRLGVADRHSREEQARHNRLRVREFDRLCRERSTRRLKKKNVR